MQSDAQRIVKVIVIPAIVGMLLAAATVAVWGQQPTAPVSPGSKYVLSEVQTLRLQLKQKDAQMAQQRMQVAQQQFQSALGDLMAEGERVRNDNKWPASAQFNADTLTFADAPAAAAPTPPASGPAEQPAPKPVPQRKSPEKVPTKQ